MAIGRVRLLRGEDAAVLRKGNEAEQSIALIASAQAGSAEAQLLYGQRLLDNPKHIEDQRAAVCWFWHSAVQGQSMAMNMLGRCYDAGLGVRIDKARAAQWYRVSADRGLDWAMFNLGVLKGRGDGVRQDPAGATALFDQVVDLGRNGKVINYIAAFHEQGWIYERNMLEAARLYAIAAQRGHPRSMFDHARMLLDAGRRSEALLWLDKAIAAGEAAFGALILDWLEERDLPVPTKRVAEPPLVRQI